MSKGTYPKSNIKAIGKLQQIESLQKENDSLKELLKEVFPLIAKGVIQDAATNSIPQFELNDDLFHRIKEIINEND